MNYSIVGWSLGGGISESEPIRDVKKKLLNY